MPEYTTKVTQFGHVLNREVVDNALLEGRVIPPVVEYLPEGSSITLDAKNEQTKKLVESGAIEAASSSKSS